MCIIATNQSCSEVNIFLQILAWSAFEFDCEISYFFEALSFCQELNPWGKGSINISTKKSSQEEAAEFGVY